MSAWIAVDQLEWQYARACRVERRAHIVCRAKGDRCSLERWQGAMKSKAVAYRALVEAVAYALRSGEQLPHDFEDGV